MKQTSAYSIGVIISTYNNPAWLEKVLWGYLFQTHPADEIVIADDGSKEDTRRLIESFKDKLPIKHVWHEDNGFQKSRILNSAILASESDYLIFTDQDCIPRKDFIATHAAYAEKGYFLSGGYFKLPMDISKQLTYNDIKSENAFSLSWLKEQHMKCNFKCTKLIKNKTFTRFMNAITPTKATWNGCNASGWREYSPSMDLTKKCIMADRTGSSENGCSTWESNPNRYAILPSYSIWIINALTRQRNR